MGNIDWKNIKGAVFDLDGTLLDSAWVWDKVDQDFLGARGFEVPDDYVEAISPLGATKAAIYTKERFGLDDENIDDIVREWFDMARLEYKVDVTCKPFAKEFVRSLYEKGIELAIATSSDRELFISTLKREGLLGYFEAVVTVDEVPRGKGFPDIYEEAARRIGVADCECVVFEDILTAVQGAKQGGFYVVGVADEKSLHQKKEIGDVSDLYIESFEELMNIDL